MSPREPIYKMIIVSGLLVHIYNPRSEIKQDCHEIQTFWGYMVITYVKKTTLNSVHSMD
jgi:hypothetical protein